VEASRSTLEGGGKKIWNREEMKDGWLKPGDTCRYPESGQMYDGGNYWEAWNERQIVHPTDLKVYIDGIIVYANYYSQITSVSVTGPHPNVRRVVYRGSLHHTNNTNWLTNLFYYIYYIDTGVA
jgi:hypothetical protein